MVGPNDCYAIRIYQYGIYPSSCQNSGTQMALYLKTRSKSTDVTKTADATRKADDDETLFLIEPSSAFFRVLL